jgi:hypothetical protein
VGKMKRMIEENLETEEGGSGSGKPKEVDVFRLCFNPESFTQVCAWVCVWMYVCGWVGGWVCMLRLAAPSQSRPGVLLTCVCCVCVSLGLPQFRRWRISSTCHSRPRSGLRNSS